MKIYYFSKAHFTDNYFLDSGRNFGDNRKDLGSGDFSKVLNSLKKELNFKRKSLFYLVTCESNKTVEEGLIPYLKKLFKDSKISLEKLSFSELN